MVWRTAEFGNLRVCSEEYPFFFANIEPLLFNCPENRKSAEKAHWK
jgi:hypothetical protein